MRTAIITGASSGIGAACAHAFAGSGLRVVLVARRAERLQEVEAAIRASGGEAVSMVADVTDEVAMDAVVAETITTYGDLQVMVCNAGLGYNARLDETPTTVMRHLMEVNFFGTFFAARAAVRHFRAAGRGHLFIVSSIVGRRGMARGGAYAATKFAQVGLGDAVRAELAGTGVDVTIVHPVSTETEFRDAMQRTFAQDVVGSGPRQSAEAVAQAMLRCLKRPRADVYPFRGSRAVAVFAALAPGLMDRLTARFSRAPREQP